jgi:large subunit ribosomal protein L24
MPVDVSNVMLVCPLCSKASRTGVRFADSGQKELYCKKCKGTVRVLSNKTAKAAR